MYKLLDTLLLYLYELLVLLQVTFHWEVYIEVFKLTQDISRAQSTIVAVQNKLKSTVSPNEVVTI